MPSLPKNSPILFISPDESYFAELNTEAKTPELMNVTKIDASLIANGEIERDSLEATLTQLKVKNIHIVVADDIFLHHIGDFPVNDKLSLEEHISNTISTAFPKQSDPLHIVTLDLAKTSRVQTIQITAMTKSNLQRISDALHAAGVTLKNMVPASFVVKAFVSIDPSLFILETPTAYLLTSHYIGVEYARTVPSAELTELSEELEKLKESHPHLQHVYLSLATSDGKVKKTVEEVFPSQPVDLPKVKAESDTPHALKALVLGYREIIENKFPFPEFEMPASTATASTPAVSPSVLEEEEAPKANELPTPNIKKAAVKTEEAVISKPETVEVPESSSEIENDEDMVAEEVHKVDKVEKPLEDEKEADVKTSTLDAVDLPKVTPVSVTAPVIKPVTPTPVVSKVEPTEQSALPTKKIVKTKRNLFSYILLGTGIAIVIALIGGGIVVSQQALQGNNSFISSNQSPEVVEPTPESTPTPTPTPTPEPIAKTDVNILVVNATTKAGYAGQTATVLKNAGYTKVQTGNAKGDYTSAGTFIMVKDTEKMPGIVAQLEGDTERSFEEIVYTTVEDTSGRYDVVIVLNE